MQYGKIFTFCILTFISILLTSRLDDVAHFATLGPGTALILYFLALQIPYILPIAIPLSCLISTSIIFQRLSTSHELTAFRASGFSLAKIFTPLLFVAFLLSLLNFYIISELATYSHMQASLLKSEVRAINPLFLLRNKHLMRAKGYYFETLGETTPGGGAEEVLLALPNRNSGRINLLVADKFSASSGEFTGKGVSLISNVKGGANSSGGLLVVESYNSGAITIEDFSKIFKKKAWTFNNDHLSLPLLLLHYEEQEKALKALKREGAPKSAVKQALRSSHRTISELFKRVSVAIAPFIFTVMGASFALSISRQRSKGALFLPILLAALYLVSFFAAESFGQKLPLSFAMYFLPESLIFALSLLSLFRRSHGYEGGLL